jgi:hypothetical protein
MGVSGMVEAGYPFCPLGLAIGDPTLSEIILNGIFYERRKCKRGR